MSICPSCGGILGRDCFNPIECAEITASIYNNPPEAQQRIQEACEVINRLYDMITTGSVGDLEFAETFIRDNYSPPKTQIQQSDDWLPF